MEKKRNIWVPWDALRYLERALTREPRSREECLLEDESVVYTVSFGDGVKMDIRVCGVPYKKGGCNRPWSEAVLFEDGRRVAYAGPGSCIRGKWSLHYKGTDYTALVRRKGLEKGSILRKFLRWVNE